ncbi:MAG: hypothetical protein AB1938_08025 [Myxococcota bacterium]
MGAVSAAVAVVASPAQQAESQGLERFFEERGLPAVHLLGLPTQDALTRVKDAVVLFTKGFEADAARRWLDAVRAADARRLVIIVTASLPAFADLSSSHGAPVLVLATPVLAWQLVDAIRNHLARRQEAADGKERQHGQR